MNFPHQSKEEKDLLQELPVDLQYLFRGINKLRTNPYYFIGKLESYLPDTKSDATNNLPQEQDNPAYLMEDTACPRVKILKKKSSFKFARMLEKLAPPFLLKIPKVKDEIEGLFQEEALIRETISYLKTREPTHSLQLNKALANAAQEYAEELGKTGQFGHTSSSGEGLCERLSRHGDWTTCIGENILKQMPCGIGTGSSKLDETEDHILSILVGNSQNPNNHNRENLLSSKFHYIGLGLAMHPIDGAIGVLEFSWDFEPPVQKARPSKFRRLKEAQGSMSEDFEKLLNCVPFLDLRETVRQNALNPDLLVTLEVSPGDVIVNIIENGVTQVLSGSWTLNTLDHRVWYDKQSEWNIPFSYDDEWEYCSTIATDYETEAGSDTDLGENLSFWLKPSGHSVSFRLAKKLDKAQYS